MPTIDPAASIADGTDLSLDSRYSSLRERIVEHVFIGEALRRLWQLGATEVELLRSEFDAGGYDVAMCCGSIMRHIQLKSVLVDGKAARTAVNRRLTTKPSGCVIWLVVTPQLEIASYLWLGGKPGEPLSSVDEMKVAKHTKGNAEGTKLPKIGHRIVPRSSFDRLDELDDVLIRLFGPLDRLARSGAVA